MNEDEADDLFANIKVTLDEIVAAPDRPNRAQKAAALLRDLEEALYGSQREDDADRIERLQIGIAALEVPGAPDATEADIWGDAAMEAGPRPGRAENAANEVRDRSHTSIPRPS